MPEMAIDLDGPSWISFPWGSILVSFKRYKRTVRSGYRFTYMMSSGLIMCLIETNNSHLTAAASLIYMHNVCWSRRSATPYKE